MTPDELKNIEIKYIMATNVAKVVSARIDALRVKMKEQAAAVRALTKDIKHHRNKLDDSSYQIINQCVPSATNGHQSR